MPRREQRLPKEGGTQRGGTRTLPVELRVVNPHIGYW